MQKPLLSPSVMGGTGAPAPANALLPGGAGHCHFLQNRESPTPEVFFIFTLLFASVLELLVMVGVYRPVPCGWHRRLCR